VELEEGQPVTPKPAGSSQIGESSPVMPVAPAATPSNANQPGMDTSGGQASDQEPTSSQSYTWQASEYIFHEKSLGWYGVFWLAVAIICAALGFFQQWLSIAVVVAMALAVLVYSRKPPRTLNYRVDGHGVTIDETSTPYANYRSYSVLEEVGWHEVDLEPTKRFVPRLTLMCESDDVDTIDAILSQHLPRVDRDPDWIERASRYLRF
jgi:hypothetical protein